MTNETQTSPSIPEDWLSAYLDGELSVDEVRTVETALSESPALQNQLNELRGVSELLKSLPQPSLEANFHESLPLDQPVRRSAGLPWKFGMTTSALVAASLVAAVLWVQTDMFRQNGPMMAENSGAPSVRSEMSVADSAEEFSVASDELAAGSLPMLDTAPFSVDASSFYSDASSFYTTTRPEPGQLLHVLENVDGNVAVVECLVLDIDEAREQLEVTLSRLGVENVPTATNDSESDSGELFAVFVQADEPVVQSVMNSARNGSFGEPVASKQMVGPIATDDGLSALRMAISSGKQGSGAKRYPGADVTPEPAAAPVTELEVAATEPSKSALPRRARIVESPSDRAIAPSRQSKTVQPEAKSAIRAEQQRFEKALPSSVAGDSIAADFGAEARPDAEMLQAPKELVNNYRVPLSITEESVSRIQMSNSITPVSTSQRVLVVLKSSSKKNRQPSAAAGSSN